jgi:myo-inositol-1(or 4)-monophosphatase
MTVDSGTLAFAHRLADAAGTVIRPYFRQRTDVIDKNAGGVSFFDPVTEADKGAETAIRALIKSEYPKDGILGEEHGEESGTSGRTWIIDPIDGTRSFITGRHAWGTLIALAIDGKPVLGIIDQPVLGERFIGHDGQAALIVGGKSEPLRARKCPSLREAVLSTTHPHLYFDERQRLLFEKVSADARMTYFGGDCYSYALVALGFTDLVVEAKLKPWDVAPLAPIIEGAGGVVSDWEGKPFTLGADIVAAGDLRVHADALKILRG